VSGVWTEWETVRRQVALCGRVVGPGGTPVADRAVRARSSRTRRSHDGRTKPDGIYFFMDLPGGDYTVRPDSPGSGQGRGRVAWDDRGNVRRAIVDIEMQRE